MKEVSITIFFLDIYTYWQKKMKEEIVLNMQKLIAEFEYSLRLGESFFGNLFLFFKSFHSYFLISVVFIFPDTFILTVVAT